MLDQALAWFSQPWKVFSVAAQFLFFMRFFVQWMHSEKKGRTVVPDAFWTFSILGGGMLLVYCLHAHEWVLALGQVGGLLIYLRNFYLIRRNRRRGREWTGPGAALKLVDQLRGELGKLSDIHDRPMLVEEKLQELEALLRPSEVGTA